MGNVTEWGRNYPWVVTAVGLLIVSALLVRWANTRPGYDPYGWLVWGKLTVHFKLDTNGAPSWKPMPYPFDVVFALAGHYALWLWMTFSVAVSLSGGIFVWRIAWRLVDAPPERRYASYVAGLFAVVALFGIRDYTHFILSAQSDTMIVSCCLAAIDCYLSGRQRWAFWLWVLGSLGRPEVWPFLGVHGLWMWLRRPEYRRHVIAGFALIPVMWFGIPALTANSPFVASNNALHSPRELHSNKFLGTLDRFLDLQELPLWFASMLAIAFAAGRRRWASSRSVLLLALGTVVWVLTEGAFALHGFPAVPRYLFEPLGVVAVLAGAAVGRIILDLPPLLARSRPRVSTLAIGWATGLLVLVFAGTLLPGARQRYHLERKDLKHEQARTLEINRLSVVVRRLGASRILACGQPDMRIGYQSVLAWYMGVKIGQLYFSANYERLHPHPVVTFYPLSNGWKVRPSHLITAADRARCRHLSLTYRS
ncbi:MAG: hypothetical protein ACYC91_06165 [Solirubrobacteraceae bacterium]